MEKGLKPPEKVHVVLSPEFFYGNYCGIKHHMPDGPTGMLLK